MKWIAAITFVFLFCLLAVNPIHAQQSKIMDANLRSYDQYESATFGAGCFWCVEAVFERLEGVVKVEAGYSNGMIKNPTYKEVCSGLTGCAEVAKVYFDPDIVSYATLLEVFWRTHDPTTLNRQGNDVGTQYRSGIYYVNDEQKEIATKSLEAIREVALYDDEIVTEIEPLLDYTAAEDYHQNYYNLNKGESYCTYVISPKVEKFKKLFKDKLKADAR